MRPAVITFAPDNFLTVGAIGFTVYFAAVFLTQVLNRAGFLTLSGPSTAIQPGSAVS